MPCGVSGRVNPQGQTRLPTDGESERRVQSERHSHSCVRETEPSPLDRLKPRPPPGHFLPLPGPEEGSVHRGMAGLGAKGGARAPSPSSWTGRTPPRGVPGLRSRSRAPGRRQRAGALSGGCTAA